MNSVMAHLRLTPLMALLFASGAAHAADKVFMNLVESVEADLAEAEARADGLARDYEQRRGLIGADEATQRYEDAVYTFLVGDYERAAMAFFVLVESEALTAAALQQDSQWYLAECLFELGNWNTALDAYGRIVASGGAHPFFEDAVRRQLEVYGILRDSEQFYDLYQRWILSGRVAPTDLVKYTVGKSFWRQGESARAKALFAEIPVGGAYYARARYFLGAVLASEGEFDAAAAEFSRVVAMDAIDPQVKELAWLALGRVHYEVGNYDAALEAYRNIPAGSAYFADQLYEMVWAYIKQGDWEGALQQTEIFLIAFPEHPYALQLKLDMGHLYMKNTAYEKALAAYESVVDDYTPLQRQLAGIENARQDIGTYFERMVEGEALDAGSASLPEYARALLTENDQVARAVEAARELRSQRSDIEDSRSAAVEVAAVLRSSNDSIGTFARGRAGIAGVRDDALGLRVRLLQLELVALDGAGGTTIDAELPRKRDQIDVLVERGQQIRDADSASSDRYQAHEDQVRAVQGASSTVELLVRDLQAESSATRRAWLDKKRDMSVADSERVERELDRADRFLEESARSLRRIQSDATRRAVMATVDRGGQDETHADRSRLVSDFDRTHRGLRALRETADQLDAAALARLDELWLRAVELDTRSVRTLAALEAAEQAELATLRRRLGEEQAAVARIGLAVQRVDGDAVELATSVTQTGFGMLEDELFETIMRADRGIVDVYWLRKTEVADEKRRLATERAKRLQELDARFGLINQKLEE